VRFQFALADRALQRQRGDDAQASRRVGLDSLVQRVDERVGLADAQRNAQHDVAGHPCQHGIDGGIQAVNQGRSGQGHGMR
jgi:hypothetical protein